jgi:alkylated DNA repair dioxygenase AlkB
MKRERTFFVIDGLGYTPEFITREEERQLMEQIDARTWNTTLKRRTQHYEKTVFSSGDTTQKAPPIPEWCDFLVKRLLAQGILDVRPDQLIINEYDPRQGIGPHVDNVKAFADGIVSVSLGSGINMIFRHTASPKAPSAGDRKDLYLERRSVLSLHNSARYDWRHEIAAKKSDEGIARGRRVSLTFRKMK